MDHPNPTEPRTAPPAARPARAPRRVTVEDPHLFPAREDVRSWPRWYVRLRGLVSLALVVALSGVGLAIFAAVVLALIVLVSIALLT